MEREEIFKTNIPGLDDLFAQGGIRESSIILVAGGTGTGKSLLCRQLCNTAAQQDKKCMYVTFDESIDNVVASMNAFGWNAQELQEKGRLLIQDINPMDILRIKFGSVSGSGSATEVSHKIKPLIIPPDFKPDVIVVDSFSAILSAAMTKDQNYRVFLNRLFNFFKDTKATSFLITETQPNPITYSPHGTAEFLADGIIVLYNLPEENSRRRKLEIIKMRNQKHANQKIPFNITNKGIKLEEPPELFQKLY